jgi:predicted esterase
MFNMIFRSIALSLLPLVFSVGGLAQAPAPLTDKDYVRVDPNPDAGFTYPYYLYVPPEVREQSGTGQMQTLLVLSNNTMVGPNDDFAVHEADVIKRMSTNGSIASALKVGILMPVFPRPRIDWRIYTLALDRDSMVTDKKEYRRFDLQMIAMIDDARKRLASEKLKFDKRVLINGFSAQGMFANRFTFLHPERVKAAVIGSPGGWPMAPVKEFGGKALRYPIGTADLKTVAGKPLDLKELKKVPLFVFIGDKDDNDSVPFGDSYDDQDKELIFTLLGKTPVSRWATAQSLYKKAGLNAVFRSYPDVGHTITPTMRDDIRAFLLKYK